MRCLQFGHRVPPQRLNALNPAPSTLLDCALLMASPFIRIACLIVFALAALGCQQDDQLEEATQRIDSLVAVNADLKQDIQDLESSISAVPRSSAADTGGIVLRPPVYFPSGSAWLTDRARQTLDQHATRIKERYEDRDFRIKGYTDDVPIGPSLDDTYPSNWYLSAQRAAAVAHYLDTEYQVRTRTLEIGAYGPQEAVAPNDTPEGRRQNRRVELVIDNPQ